MLKLLGVTMCMDLISTPEKIIPKFKKLLRNGKKMYNSW